MAQAPSLGAPSLRILTVFLAAGIGLTCGPVKSGALFPNDPVPTGTIVSQGSFTGLSGFTVSGTAVIYSDGTGSANYLVRLNGLSAPSEAGLQVVVVAGGSTVASFNLRYPTGNQNYQFTAGNFATFNQVNIHSNTRNTDYGQALMRATTTGTTP